MPTANTHIERALYLIGASSPIKPASPEIKDQCLTTFNDMVSRWAKQGYETGLVKASSLGSEVYNDDYFNPVIQYSLAVECAPICRVPVPPEVFKRQSELARELLETTALEALVPDPVQYDPRLARGSGVTRERAYISRFYREGEGE